MAITAINDTNFEAEVLKADVPVVVDFFATWCGPCQAQTPILEELADKLGDKAKFVKIDVDQSPNTAQKYGIMSIPTLKIFKDGEEKQNFVGVTQAAALESALGSL